MDGFVGDIEKLALENTNFRKVIYTAKHSQLVVMSIPPKGEIGMEVHPDNDQFLRVEKGTGQAIIDGNTQPIVNGTAVIVPAGSQHNIVNSSETEALKLYTVYSPPHHRDQVVHATKADADSDNEEFDGKTTE